MQHLSVNGPVACSEAPLDRDPRPGEWMHLASRDPAAAPGRVRLHLTSRADVARVYEALDGQTLAVGTDRMAITVHNDVEEAGPTLGNGRWGRG